MFKDNFSADIATLTPSKLLMTNNNNNNEWALNAPTVNEFNTYMNEMNPFDDHPSLFDQKFNQPMQQQVQQEPLIMLPNNTTTLNYATTEAPLTPPTPTRDADGEPPKKQRKKLLEKNREAAYRCRQKKKRWVNELEEKSENMEHKNKELRDQVTQLREESIYLRNLLLTHGNCDCDVVQTYLRRTSEKLSSQVPALIGSSSSSESSVTSNNKPMYSQQQLML